MSQVFQPERFAAFIHEGIIYRSEAYANPPQSIPVGYAMEQVNNLKAQRDAADEAAQEYYKKLQENGLAPADPPPVEDRIANLESSFTKMMSRMEDIVELITTPKENPNVNHGNESKDAKTNSTQSHEKDEKHFAG